MKRLIADLDEINGKILRKEFTDFEEVMPLISRSLEVLKMSKQTIESICKTCGIEEKDCEGILSIIEKHDEAVLNIISKVRSGE